MANLAVPMMPAAVLEKIQYRMPFANLGYYRTRYAHYERELDVEHMIGALRKAGVPSNAYGFEGNPADRLGADELQALVCRKRLGWHRWTRYALCTANLRGWAHRVPQQHLTSGGQIVDRQ